MELKSYNFYTMQNVHSSTEDSMAGYVHIPNAAMTRTQIRQWNYEGRGVKFVDHFEYLFVEVEGAESAASKAKGEAIGRTFFIVNRRSGLPLVVDSIEDKTPLEQSEWPVEPTTKAQFVLKSAGDDRFQIMSQFSGAYLAVEPGDKAPRTNGLSIVAINEVDMASAANADPTKHEFRLAFVAPAFGKLDLLVDTGLAEHRNVPRIKSMSTGLPDATVPKLLDFDRLPFLQVTDPFLPPHRQIDVSPWYTLRRYRLWQKMYDRELDGIVARESTETTRLGMTQVAVQSVKTTLSASVQTTASASYSGFGVKAGVSVTARLAAEATYSEEQTKQLSQERVTEDKISYPSVGEPYRIAKWRPIDRYELYRADNVIINRWDVVREDEEVIDVFSASSKNKPKRREQQPRVRANA